MLSKALTIFVLVMHTLVGAAFASDLDKNPLGGGGLAAPTIPVPAEFRAFSDFCITEQWKFHLACLRNKDDAPRWIQDNYAKNGKVGFYEDSIWRYIPKAIIDVCCDGNSDISPGAQPAEFRQQNWNALLLKKSIAQCQKYLQSGKRLRNVGRDIDKSFLEFEEKSRNKIDERLRPMKDEWEKEYICFICDEITKLYRAPLKFDTLPNISDDDAIEKHFKEYFDKIGRPEEYENFFGKIMGEIVKDETKIPEKLRKLRTELQTSTENAELAARQAFLGSYRLGIKIGENTELCDPMGQIYDEFMDKLVHVHFIKLAADELKSDAKYSSFTSDIDAAFDDVAIYTKVLDVFQFIERQVSRSRPVNSGTGYFKYGNDQAVLLKDFCNKVGNVVKESAWRDIKLKSVAPYFDKQDVAGRVILSDFENSYGESLGGNTFFKKFPEQYKKENMRYANFFNGKGYYYTYEHIFKLDDKMNFVKEVASNSESPIYDILRATNKYDGDDDSGYEEIFREETELDDASNKSEWKSEQEKIRKDIEELENDKTKTKELEKYKRQLGAKRARDLFWFGIFVDDEKYDERSSRTLGWELSVGDLRGFLRQIKGFGVVEHFDFLGKEAVRLGEIDAFPQYKERSEFWEEFDIKEKRKELVKFINEKLFSVKNLKRIINEACLKGIAERKFHEDEILRFVEKITDRCLESAREIDWKFQGIEKM